MVEPIDKERAADSSSGPSSKQTSQGSSSGSASQGAGPSKYLSHPQPQRIQEEENEEDRGRSDSEPVRPTYLLSPSQSRLASSSPGELTPAEDSKVGLSVRGERKTDPLKPKFYESKSIDHAAAAPRAQTLDPKAGQPSYFPPVQIAATTLPPDAEAEKQRLLGGSARQQQLGDDGVLRKDTALTLEEKKERNHEHRGEMEEAAEFGLDGWGQSFNIQWIKLGSLPFGRTRHLRNPWNADREVKVSRDGTEVEPSERSLPRKLCLQLQMWVPNLWPSGIGPILCDA